MTWVNIVLGAITSLLAELAGPLLAFLAGKEYQQSKEAERHAHDEKERAQSVSDALKRSSDVDLMRGDDVEQLRNKLNKRT